MNKKISRKSIRNSWIKRITILSIAVLYQSTTAFAGSLSWLDDFVQASMRQADPKMVSSRPARLFARETAELGDDSLSILARRTDELSGLARKTEEPAAGLMDARFSRLVGNDENMARDFAKLTPSEKKLAVVLGEAAQKIARRFPGQADTMIRKMGADGLSAVAVYGDEVAEVLAIEGPQAVTVLRKTGRPGWKFFTEKVLPNKQKLAAAGILTAFMTSPEEFVDMAGQATEFAVRQFASAGIELATAVTGGAISGLETAVGNWLESQGLNFSAVRYFGMVLAGWVVLSSAMFLLGLPGRVAMAPIIITSWPIRRFMRMIRG